MKLLILQKRFEFHQRFDELEKKWLSKLEVLKDYESRSKVIVRLQELDIQHLRLTDRINS